MKTKLLSIFCAFCAMSLFAQVPTPVIGLDFENDETVDVVGSPGIDVVAHNATYEDDAERGNVIVFDGLGTGSTAPSSFTGTWVDLTPEVFEFEEVTFNLWFNCSTTVELWSRLLTLCDTNLANSATPTAFICVNNNRTTPVGPDGAQQNQLTYSIGSNDAEVVAGGNEIGAGQISADTWYMLTVTHSIDAIQIYLDGELKAESTAVFAPNNFSVLGVNHVGLGTSQWGDDLFYGKMDNFTVYDYVLDEDEIGELYSCTENCIKPVIGIKRNVSNQPNVYSANGIVYIKNVNNIDINSVQIYNMLGNLVYQTNDFNEVINLNLPSSMYIVKIQSDKGNFANKVNIQ